MSFFGKLKVGTVSETHSTACSSKLASLLFLSYQHLPAAVLTDHAVRGPTPPLPVLLRKESKTQMHHNQRHLSACCSMPGLFATMAVTSSGAWKMYVLAQKRNIEAG